MAPLSPPEADAEAALAAHWSQLGLLEGSELHEEAGVKWFETPVRHLPYNGVVRTLADDLDAVDRVLRRMRERGVEFWWCVHPSATPDALADHLTSAALRMVERMHFMVHELEGDAPAPAPAAGVEVRPAVDAADTAAYTALTVRYWEVPDEEAASVAELHRGILPDRFPGQRFLALVDGEPVGKAYLSWPGPPGVASIYGMSVLPSARGRGVAGALTGAMLADVRARGLERVVLHATDMAVGVYARAGFRPCGGADVYATTALWTDP